MNPENLTDKDENTLFSLAAELGLLELGDRLQPQDRSKEKSKKSIIDPNRLIKEKPYQLLT